MDTCERFTATVGAYRRHRPDYPAALVDWVLEEGGWHEGDLVIDVGCGTGIASRAFARRGLRVVGVDPNAAMIAAARAERGGPHYVEGRSEDLPVDDHGATGAVSGQAFHWFDLDRTLAELARALRPEGTCAAFWNLRDESTDFLREYDLLLRKHCPEYPVASAHETIRQLGLRPAAAHLREARFPHSQLFDWEGLRGRAWSTSYVANGVRDEASFDRDLLALFARHEVAGIVSFQYTTTAVAFEPQAA